MRWTHCVLLLIAASAAAEADTFGSGENAFTIPFVTVGDPGNAADTTGAPNPAGSVAYEYRIGKYEIPEEAIRKANAASEAAGDPLGITIDERGLQKPATRVSWFEAARFVNWLNADKGAPAAYKFDSAGDFQLWQLGDPGYDPDNAFRNSRARYFLPSVDEWYKAAFYDPVTESYFDYPTSSNDPPIPVASGTDPDTAVWNQAIGPADVQLAGGESPWGTVAQGGNIVEWQETNAARSFGVDSLRALRGGKWTPTAVGPVSLAADALPSDRLPQLGAGDLGFRIMSIPEPSSVTLLLMAAISRYKSCTRRRDRRITRSKRTPRCEVLEDRRVLATFSVNSLADTVFPVEGQGLTIREAVQYINGDFTPEAAEKVQNGVVLIDESVDPIGQNDTVVFDDALFNADNVATISLNAIVPNDFYALEIIADVVIDGGDGRRVILDASGYTTVDRGVMSVITQDGPVGLRNLALTGGVAGSGGGLLSKVDDLTVFDVEIYGNTADNGGGVALRPASASSTASLEELVIHSNLAVGEDQPGQDSGFGGGLLINTQSLGIFDSAIDASVSDLWVYDNEARRGGGVAVVANSLSTVVVETAVIESNKLRLHGGGVYIANSPDGDSDGIVALRDAVVRENSATGPTHTADPLGGLGGTKGGGIFVTGSQAVLIDGVSISDNVLPIDVNRSFEEISHSAGGGLYADVDGAPLAPELILEVVNTTIDGNVANQGGGVNAEGARAYGVRIRHSTIVGNTADTTYFVSDPSQVRDSIPGGYGGGIVLKYTGVHPFIDDFSRPLFLDHTIVIGNTDVSDDFGGPFASNPIGNDVWVDNFDASGPTDGQVLVPVVASSVGSVAEDITVSGSQVFGGSLAPITTPLGGRAYAPLNGYVNSGGYVAPSLPGYDLPEAAALLGPIDTDQRQSPYSRVFGVIDIGAIEAQAPRVTNVVLSSTAYADDVHDYNEVIETPIANGVATTVGVQLVPMFVRKPDEITITFSEPIAAPTADFFEVLAISEQITVAGVDVGPAQVSQSDFSGTSLPVLSADGLSLTWTLSTPLEWGQYLIRLNEALAGGGASFLSEVGYQLDGDWSNPATTTTSSAQISRFPSGDGVEGGDFEFAVTHLFEDYLLAFNEDGTAATAAGAVDNSQLNAMLGNWGLNDGDLGAEDGDFNLDGMVDNGDLNVLLGAWGVDLRFLRDADFNDDGEVDAADTAEFAGIYSGTPLTVDSSNVKYDINKDGVIDAIDEAFVSLLQGRGMEIVG